ncbi:MAG: sporulation protein YabP [Lachnospiraceae bacterium]|nr:sporulation protein YabP [Lachnospiraceae bacterium]
MEQSQPGTHKLLMTNRGSIVISGIIDVISFDLKEIILESTCGMLTIKGSDLKVRKVKLEEGEVEVEGSADSINYSDVSSFSKKGKSIMKRLLS